MPCLFVWSSLFFQSSISVCGKSGFSSLKLSENEAGRDCHLCILWRFRWPWWTVLCRTRGANLRSKSSTSWSPGRKTSPSPPIWRRTSLRASEIEPRMWATRLNPQGKNVRTTRFLQTNDSKTTLNRERGQGAKMQSIVEFVWICCRKKLLLTVQSVQTVCFTKNFIFI